MKNKKAILEKLARQKAAQERNIFKIPKVTVSQKLKKAKKSFIPTVKTLAKKSENEEKMRQFLNQLVTLTAEDLNDFIIVGNNIFPSNNLVKSGFDYFVKDNIGKYPVIQNKETQKRMISDWQSLSDINRKQIILITYGKEDGAEFGRKEFIGKIIDNIGLNLMEEFIRDYLKEEMNYNDFYNWWIDNTKHKKQLEKDEKKRLEEEFQKAKSSKPFERREISEEDKKKISKLNKELEKLEKQYTKYIFESSDKLENLSKERSFERSKKIKNLESSIFHLKNEIKKLSTGLLVPVKKDEIILSEKENEYLYYIKKEIRKYELLKWSKQKLMLHAGIYKNIHKKSVLLIGDDEVKRPSVLSEGELINLIINAEFPKIIFDPNPTREQTRNVLKKLTHEQLEILGNHFGLKNTKIMGKHLIIDSVMRKKFAKEDLSSKMLVVGDDPDYLKVRRREELESMTSKEIRTIAFSIGLDISKKVSDEELITQIINNDINVSKLIDKEKDDKKKLIKKLSGITGRDEDAYKLWSLEELKQRLQGIDDEMWPELEKERMLQKLGEMINIDISDGYLKKEIIKKLVDITGQKEEKYKLWSLTELKQRMDAIGYEKGKEKFPGMDKNFSGEKFLKRIDYKEWSNHQLLKKLEEISDDWRSYTPLIENYSFTKCMAKYIKYPWIEADISSIWLSGVGDNKPDSEYIYEDVSIEQDGKIWYQATQKYLVLQCNQYKSLRKQKGHVFTCVKQTGEKVSFNVGFTAYMVQPNAKKKYDFSKNMIYTEDKKYVQRLFIKQDEVMFAEELRYLKQIEKSTDQRIKDILYNFVDNDTFKIAIDTLSQSLHEISPTIKDYGTVTFIQVLHPKGHWYQTKKLNPNTVYNQIVIETLKTNLEQTNKEFFTKLAELLVYVKDIPEAKIFKYKLMNEFYLPDILPTLSHTEKFPEVFEDPNISVEYMENITSNINNKISKIVHNFAEILYRIKENPKFISRHVGYMSPTKQIKTHKRISACSNNTKFKDYSKEYTENNIVYYKDDGKIYCFTINELYEQFINGDIKNPETGKDFSIKFVTRFDELYNKHLSSDGLLTDYFQKKYGFDIDKIVKEKMEQPDRPDIASDLWNIIGKDISELENELTNEEPQEGEVIQENREPEKRQEEFEEHGTPIEISKEEACVYCNKHLSNDSIKTVVRHGEESRIVKFCSFKCFEHKDDWEKFPKKKKRKHSKKDNKKPNNPKEKVIQVVEKKKKLKPGEGSLKIDRIFMPLMTKQDLKKLAKKKNIKLAHGLSKIEYATQLFKKFHPYTDKKILSEEDAKKKVELKRSRN